MPTLRGWAALGAALALALLWVGFGEQLLLALAAFFLLAVLLGSLYVRRAGLNVSMRRVVAPIQVHDGDRAIVEVTMTSSRRLHEAVVEDIVHGLGAATFVASQVRPASPMVARYEVLCRPRGIYKLGPATVKVHDPLDLSEFAVIAGKADRLVVYPQVEQLDGVPTVRGQDPNVNTASASFSLTGGEDFFTLREYQQGDDLRRVHWPSSARRDKLMIKQLEMPWQSRALVILDTRSQNYPTPEAFEHAVRGAASSLAHLYRHGYSPSLWIGEPALTQVSSSQAYAVAMEQLATVSTTPGLDLRSAVARMRRSGMAGGALVLVTGTPDDSHLGVYRTLGQDYVRTLLMSVTNAPNDAIMKFRTAGAVTVLSSSTSKWAPAWHDAMERAWSSATAG
ncbi:MAG: DUF58 domain-containing protein [Acidimicrobiia bacterium]|nr:DUF58 domain-containing protein [Acidimicrobiia bacterium]